jgi:uncharacterized Fe-S cluster-containing radical SAM superfamily protein
MKKYLKLLLLSYWGDLVGIDDVKCKHYCTRCYSLQDNKYI